MTVGSFECFSTSGMQHVGPTGILVYVMSSLLCSRNAQTVSKKEMMFYFFRDTIVRPDTMTTQQLLTFSCTVCHMTIATEMAMTVPLTYPPFLYLYLLLCLCVVCMCIYSFGRTTTDNNNTKFPS